MSLTSTQIVNIALGKAQVQGRISDLSTDTSKEARRGRDIYEQTRDAMLRSHVWNFSKARVELAEVTPDDTLVGFDKAFALPADFLRIIAVSPVNEDNCRVKYKAETVLTSSAYARVLLTNSTTLFLRYVRQVTETALFDPMFIEAFTWQLAADFASSIEKSNSHAEFCRGEYRKELASARAANGIEDFPDEFPMGSWVTERNIEGDNWYGDNWA
jgi:hypothetical protein